MHVLLMYTVSQWYKKVVRLICGVGRLHHTNMLFYRCRVLKCQDLVDLCSMCSIMYKTYNNMPVPVNIQCFFLRSMLIYVLLEISVNMYVNVSIQILSRDGYQFMA